MSGTAMVRTDAASIWATGKTWWQIPPIAKVKVSGVLPKGVTGKDVIVALCGLFNNDEVLNHAIEFTGSEQTMMESAESNLLGSSAEGKEAEESDEALTAVLPGFPETVEGEIVFCDADNINTDGIYPGKYTYQDNVPVEKMAEVCMENYDPKFGLIAKEGDILVAGFNFGCGSSREQAATAILAKKDPIGC
jgi:aconitase A